MGHHPCEPPCFTATPLPLRRSLGLLVPLLHLLSTIAQASPLDPDNPTPLNAGTTQGSLVPTAAPIALPSPPVLIENPALQITLTRPMNLLQPIPPVNPFAPVPPSTPFIGGLPVGAFGVNPLLR